MAKSVSPAPRINRVRSNTKSLRFKEGKNKDGGKRRLYFLIFLCAIIKEEKLKKRFYSPDFSYYDENGKINWDVISQFMPPYIEKYIHENYSMLNGNEIRLCCLLFFNVSGKTIANILPYKQKSIRSILFKVKRKTGLNDIKEMFEKIIVNKA